MPLVKLASSVCPTMFPPQRPSPFCAAYDVFVCCGCKPQAPAIGSVQLGPPPPPISDVYFIVVVVY